MLSPRRESHMIEKTSSNGSSAIRRDWSQLPASTPGTIRVIHIFSPKVIKTDVANFRALVQKLTGKSKKDHGSGSGSRKRTLKSRSLTSSDGTFSMASSTDTSTIQSSAAAETCSESSTRSSNSASHVADSNSTVSKSAFVFSSTDSCTISASPKLFGLPSSFGSSQTHHQVLPAEISAAFFRSQTGTGSSSNSRSRNSSTCSIPNNNNSSSSSNRHNQSSVMVDPLQSLSGYKDNWASLQASCNFSLSSEQQQQSPFESHSRQPFHMSLNAYGFSDMDILTGLVSPVPSPEFSLPPPVNNNNHISININNNSIATPSEHFLLSNHPSICRLSVPSVLRGSVSPFEHF